MSDKEIIKKILKNYISVNWKKKFYWISFFWVLVATIWILEPFFYVKIINFIETYYMWWEVVFSDIYLFVVIWGVYIFFSLVTNYFYRYYLVDRSVLGFHKKFYEKWTEKIILMSYSEYLNKKQWSLFKKFDRGVMDQFNFFFFFFLDLIKNLSGIFIIVVVLFYINYKMAIATLIMLPFMVFIGLYFNRKTAELQKQVNKDWDKSYWVFGDALWNLWLIKTLSLEKKFWKLMKEINKDAVKKQLKVSKRWSFADIYTGLLVMISRVFVLLLWFYLLINWELSLSILFLYFSFIGYIYFPISFIFSKLRHVQEYISSIRNFYDEFWNLNLDIDSKKSKDIINIKWEIEFKKVNFSYTKDKKIIKDISFKIKPWEKIAFVGNTWAGKSTIVNLLFRFWDINSWKILLDWNNINDISKKTLRKNIGLVMQENTLFNTTIKENLEFASPGATEKDVKNALKKAEANFVFDLKDWINTIIGERWLKLSWWEKQRLSIARLFLKNPKILVLDEATSALDNKTEKLVQKALDTLMEWRTSIVIAHRLSTIQNATKIIMLENWKIVEEGEYNELMKRKSNFYDLANPDNLILN